MDEKQRMLCGQLYLANDEQLSAERLRAKKLCWQFNRSEPGSDEAQAILSKLLEHSPKPHIEAPFFCDYGYNIKTGINFYANHGCCILDCAEISIGDDVLLGPGVVIASPNHPLDEKQRRLGYEHAQSITIESGVWVGAQACICPGVHIGRGAVIAAGAVVTKNIKAHTLVAGCPAKFIRTIT
ncbi:sugar O-acetyltransferase [Agaribacterium haliotis]|uniref:sugar O-acetyltransferase n=1 Tax=Agaribacterium haliotis TaxID=2013869 RepID=UPI000BB59E90|nr:sugar O-acetyltransferase [Agaribacterium haliotis]